MKVGDKVRLKKGYRDRRLTGTVSKVFKDQTGVKMIEVIDCKEPGNWQADWWEVVKQAEMDRQS